MANAKGSAATTKAWATRKRTERLHDDVVRALFTERDASEPTLEARQIERPSLGVWLDYFLVRNHDEPIPKFAAKGQAPAIEDREVQAWITKARAGGGSGVGAPNALRWALRWLRLSHATASGNPMNPEQFVEGCNAIVDKLGRPGTKPGRALYQDALPSDSRARLDDWPESLPRFSSDWLLARCRWRSWSRLPVHEVCVVVTYLYEQGVLRRGADTERLDTSELDAVHDAVRRFLGIEVLSHDAFAEAVVGRYFLFRPSFHLPGAVLKSRLEIQAGESKALVVTEDHEHAADGDAAGFTERYIGLIWRKSNVPLMLMIRRRDKGENPFEARGAANARGAARVSLLPHVIFDATDGNVAAISGFTLANFAGAHTHALPVCIERSKLTREEWESVPIGVAMPEALEPRDAAGVQSPQIPMSVARRLRAMEDQIGDGWDRDRRS